LFFALAPNEKQRGTKTTMSDIRNDDAVQHGIDDDAHNDGKKGLELGALGGGAVGALAGAALGPVGMIVGALIGGSVGSVASGAAVEAVDTVDNDNTVSGVGEGATLKSGGTVGGTTYGSTTPGTGMGATHSGDYERGSYVGGSDMNTSGTTGHIDDTGAGKAGLAGGALVGGTIGAAVGGPVGAVVGGTIGSLVGGATGNAGEAAAEPTTGTGAGYNTGGTHGTTGHIDDTGAGKAGLAGGALIGGTIGAAVGGPVGAVVGGTVGSLVGGATGNAGEAAAESTTGTGYNTTSSYASAPDVHATDERYASVAGKDYSTRPYGTYEGRSVSRTDYNKMPENDRMRVQLLQEELQVDKQVRQVGEVEIGKRVVSEQVSVPVSLQREEVIIHQTNVSGGNAGGAVIGEGQTITVPISEEFAQVSKTTSVAGEVEIEKRMTTEQKTISDTVRHEELDVNKGTTGRVTMDDETKGKM